ncbi:MAG: aldo/keto reductase [Candidatus Doudnabacteria bacterium]|nr:aldo/keto reductase [Candidatus Doudnabacteria bacterium]
MRTAADLFLGTVKLGVPEYGFSSTAPVVSFDAQQFLCEAVKLGISRFDTSPRYGNSEEVIGHYIGQASSKPFVASKIDNLAPNNSDTPGLMEKSVNDSLAKLHLSTLDICYLHQNEMEIISDPYIHQGLSLLKEKGLVRQAGASVYSKEECSYAVDCGIFDVIQAPVSVFDLGFYNDFVLNKNPPVTLIARSLLLQGILVNRRQIKGQIKQSDAVLQYLDNLDQLAKEADMSTLDMALAFVYGLSGIDYYIIGTTSLENLKHNIECLKLELPRHIISEIKVLAGTPKQWTNPRNWSLNG